MLKKPDNRNVYSSIEQMNAAIAEQAATAAAEQDELENGTDIDKKNAILHRRLTDPTRSIAERAVDRDDYSKSIQRIKDTSNPQ